MAQDQNAQDQTGDRADADVWQTGFEQPQLIKDRAAYPIVRGYTHPADEPVIEDWRAKLGSQPVFDGSGRQVGNASDMMLGRRVRRGSTRNSTPAFGTPPNVPGKVKRSSGMRR